MERNDLTQGSVGKNLIRFALPYLLACFMQTFYGMADLFVVGLYNGSETTTAVSIGSQVMHMLTVIIVGLVMGATVRIGRYVGAKDERGAGKTVGCAIVLFSAFAAVLTVILLLDVNIITNVMLTPQEAVSETRLYLLICFAGIPFITAYNVVSGVFRGAGDSRRPMYFVAVACVVNIALDFVLIGGYGLGAAGAALGTVLGQAVSVVFSLVMMRGAGFWFSGDEAGYPGGQGNGCPDLQGGIAHCLPGRTDSGSFHRDYGDCQQQRARCLGGGGNCGKDYQLPVSGALGVPFGNLRHYGPKHGRKQAGAGKGVPWLWPFDYSVLGRLLRPL